jgi:hypothetical protein
MTEKRETRQELLLRHAQELLVWETLERRENMVVTIQVSSTKIEPGKPYSIEIVFPDNLPYIPERMGICEQLTHKLQEWLGRSGYRTQWLLCKDDPPYRQKESENEHGTERERVRREVQEGPEGGREEG